MAVRGLSGQRRELVYNFLSLFGEIALYLRPISGLHMDDILGAISDTGMGGCRHDPRGH